MEAFVKSTLFFLVLILSSTFVLSEESEQTKNFAVKFIFGTSAFLDEDTPFDHSVFGGSIPIRLTKKLSIEPQFLYMNGPGSDRDITISGNVVYDLVTKDRASIFVVGGAGILSNTQRFSRGNFTANDWTANGGIGAKFFISEKFFVSPEFRFGTEPLLTVTAGIGYQF
jgi:hypothetical protein